MLKLNNHDVDIAIVIEYFEGIMRVALAICGIILTCNTMKIKINNKANFMAISTLYMAVFTILQLGIYIKHKDYILLLGIYDKCKWITEYLQIIALFICVNSIDKHISLKTWSIIFGVICGVAMIFVWSPHWITFKTISYSKGILQKQIVSIGCVLFASHIYAMSYKKIMGLLLFEKKLISGLFGIKLIVSIITALNLNINSSGLYIVYEILQLIFSLLIIAYIDELTLSITWKQIDLGVQNKNKQVTKGYMEQRTLVVAAREIQKMIDRINRKTLNLEMQLAEKCSNQYIKYIEKIKNNCHRLLKLSMNILDLNTYEKGKQTSKFELINLTALIGSVVESLETYIMQRGIKIIYTASKECIMAEVDKESIERLFLNLLSNAVKYNKVNGTIKVILTEKKKKIYLCIQDTGIGIPSHYLDLIFEKFQRVNAGLAREQEGSGLGLSIVKSLVDIHHGEIKIVSKEERGTLISIGLPIVQGELTDRIKCTKRHKDDLDEKIKVEFSDLDRY